jgi:hypothetical protein
MIPTGKRATMPRQSFWIARAAGLPGTVLLGAVLLAAAASPAAAQNYSFSVPEMQMLVTVNRDASVTIVYDITFQNNPGARAIEIVDIGTPDRRYNLKTVKASIDEKPLDVIRASTEIATGFEVHLAPHVIRAGNRGTLRVEFTMPDRVYQDTTRGDYASLRIGPTWWGERFVTGTTDLRIAVQLPKSVQPDEALHQGLNFTEKAMTERGALVGWAFPEARMNDSHAGRGKYQVAVSFPKRDLQRVVAKTKLDLLLDWFAESVEARLVAGGVFLVLFGFAFFRFTGGTGVSVFVILSAAAVYVFVVSPGLHLCSLPAAVALVALNEWAMGRHKPGYMPPIAQVEGGGIKRGLTAPEAAALLELPLAKVLGLVIFGLLKKGALRQVRDEPLAVEVDEAFRVPPGVAAEKDRAKFYRKAGRQRGVVIHTYEHPFLFLLERNPGKPVREIDFTLAVRRLLQGVAGRMKGFDLSDTQDYYRAIVRRAVAQAAAVGDVEQREKTIDSWFEWILMGDDYPTVFTGRPYRPVWTRGSGTPAGGGTVSAPAAPSVPSGPSPAGRTTFGDVAASFARWSENTMGGLASAITPGALRVDRPGGGFLDLSGADRATGAFFKALGEAAASGGGGGRGGGGCACACAGCACACACAGGGR